MLEAQLKAQWNRWTFLNLNVYVKQSICYHCNTSSFALLVYHKSGITQTTLSLESCNKNNFTEQQVVYETKHFVKSSSLPNY